MDQTVTDGSGRSPVPEYSCELLLLLPPPDGREENGIGDEEEDEGVGPSEAIISMTLGRTM